MEDKFHQHPANPSLEKRSSERAFGYVMAIFFMVVGGWPILSGAPLRAWSLALALVFVILSVFAPAKLHILNKCWVRLGLALNKVISPLVLTLIYIALFVPTGLVFKVLNKDLLKLQLEKNSLTYWQLRNPPGPAPETMPYQF